MSGEDIAHARDAVSAAQAALDAVRQQVASQPRADRPHDDRTASERAGRGIEGARRVSRLRAQHAARAGDGLCREALGAGRPARVAGHAADGDRAARRRLGRRELQGSAADAHAHRPAGDADRRRVRLEGEVPRQGRSASRRARARRSRCCPRRTRPATGSRSCSVCRCASSSIRRNWKRIRCASACRWMSTSKRATTAGRSSAPRRTRRIGRTCSANTATRPMPRSRRSSSRTCRQRVRARDAVAKRRSDKRRAEQRQATALESCFAQLSDTSAPI